MHAQIITYQLEKISQDNYIQQMVKPDAPVLAAVKGLHSKTWLSNPETNTYGGFYVWENKSDMDAFMASDLVKTVVSRPFVANIHSSDFAIPAEATKITRGITR